MDVSKINTMGWKASISLRDGIERVYNDIKNMDWN
jgi:GDP-L-fucose synthase